VVERRRRLVPFYSAESRRLAAFFATVYFAQGMWSLPNQALKMALKDRRVSASGIEAFFAAGTLPWLLKPVYGLLSDLVPIAGRRRVPYLVMGCALAAGSALAINALDRVDPSELVLLLGAMALGFAFIDVLTDALMVEKGRPSGLTGPYQGVQWAAVKAGSLLVGVIGGHLAANREVGTAFAVVSVFPLLSLAMVGLCVREERRVADRAALARTVGGIRQAVASRDLWAVAGFVFFWTFSPALDTALLFHQSDVLHFGQRFIGLLSAVGAVGGIAGALAYPLLSRRMRLRRLVNLAIGLGLVGTLAYLAYGGPVTALVIELAYGCAGTIATLAFMELAAKAAPRHVEATFFALLMAVYNAGARVSGIVGGLLYNQVGYPTLVVISAVLTALAWLLVPYLDIDALVARALAAVREPEGASPAPRNG
jgi:predicted MFS family arabinose efflux permease